MTAAAGEIMETKKHGFSWRAFVSIGLVYSFIIIAITGTILYLAPKGKIARWTDWHIFGLTKYDWEGLHTVFSYSFVLFSLVHLFVFNWACFVSYIKRKTARGLEKKPEIILVTGLCALVLAGTVVPFPPFSWVLNYGEHLSQSWETAETAPPIPNAEELTLDELSQEHIGITAVQAVKRLQGQGFRLEDDGRTLEEIAAANSTTPMAVYRAVLRQDPGAVPGRGIGRKTLDSIALETHTTAEALIDVLQKNGISARKHMTLSQIADTNSISTRQVYELLAEQSGKTIKTGTK